MASDTLSIPGARARLPQQRPALRHPYEAPVVTRLTPRDTAYRRLVTHHGRSTPADLLTLQRLAGNRAVASTLTVRPREPMTPVANGTVQRRLPRDKAIGSLQLPGAASPLSVWITRYNAKEKELSPARRIAWLNTISRVVYMWYASQDTTDLSTLGGKDTKAIRKLEESIAEQHAKAVQQLLAAGPQGGAGGGGGLGADPTATNHDRAMVLLHSIAAGTGPIKIAGSAAFTRKAHSMLYRIMESDTGLKLLEAIAARAGTKRSVTIGEGEPPAELKGHLATPSAEESMAIPQVSRVGKDTVSTKKTELADQLTNMTKLGAKPTDPGKFGTVIAPGDIHRAITSGMRGIKFTQAGKTVYYQFAAGAPGVYVALVHKPLGETADNVNLAGKSVYTPAFVTLAHELGHALNILAGASTMSCADLFKLFAGDVGTFEAPTAARTTWTSAEEFATINEVENGVRKELGIELRGGHYAVLDQNLEDSVQALRGVTRGVQLLVYKVGTALKDKPNVSAKQLAALDALEQSVGKLGGAQVKGLGPAHKRNRCVEYESTVAAALKKIASMSKTIKAEVIAQLTGDSASLKADILRHAPDALPRALR